MCNVVCATLNSNCHYYYKALSPGLILKPFCFEIICIRIVKKNKNCYIDCFPVAQSVTHWSVKLKDVDRELTGTLFFFFSSCTKQILDCAIIAFEGILVGIFPEMLVCGDITVTTSYTKLTHHHTVDQISTLWLHSTWQQLLYSCSKYFNAFC